MKEIVFDENKVIKSLSAVLSQDQYHLVLAGLVQIRMDLKETSGWSVYRAQMI